MSLSELTSRLKTAKGASNDLDNLIADTLHVSRRQYSASVDDCIALLHELFPDAHWHLGRAANGVSMYATLDDGVHREESAGTTIPLVLLSVIVAHLGRH